MLAIRLPAVVPVSGVSFRQAELREVVEGDVLTAIAVEDNPHDADAVEVRTASGVLVGFVPKGLAGRLRATGATSWPALVREVLRGETWGLRIELHPAGSVLVAGRDQAAQTPAGAATQSPDGAVRQPEPPGQRAESTVARLADDRASRREEDATARAARQHVIAPSGRVLGEYVRTEGARVIARSRGGEVSFPAHTVVLRPFS